MAMASESWLLAWLIVSLSVWNQAQSRRVFHTSPLIVHPSFTSNQSRARGVHSRHESSRISAAPERGWKGQRKHVLGERIPAPPLKLSKFLKSSKAKAFTLKHRLDSQQNGLIRSTSSQPAKNESVHFGLSGATYPNGLYYTTIQLGNPAQTFKVSIDTGSNLLWVNCQPCDPCVTSNTQQLNPPYDRKKSKSVIPVSCNSYACTNPDITLSTNECPGSNSKADCEYTAVYGDSSGSSGVLLNETFWLPVTSQEEPTPLRMIFGCGNSQSGLFVTGSAFTTFQGLDGLLGLGRGTVSLVTSLNQTHVESIVSHCLGGVNGRGSLFFGSLNVPSQYVVYTPLKYDESFYRVSLKSILVGGRTLSVPPKSYGNTLMGNAAFDSGTTYTQLPTSIYKVLINAIKVKVGLKPIFDNPVGNKGTLCFSPTPSISSDDLFKMFPTITLQFEGNGAFLNINPSTYVYHVNFNNNNISCTRLIPTDIIQSKIFLYFIFGDLWMRDFLIIHDLKNSRIGWSPMKCTE